LECLFAGTFHLPSVRGLFLDSKIRVLYFVTSSKLPPDFNYIYIFFLEFVLSHRPRLQQSSQAGRRPQCIKVIMLGTTGERSWPCAGGSPSLPPLSLGIVQARARARAWRAPPPNPPSALLPVLLALITQRSKSEASSPYYSERRAD
jgi:hypothetical protein